MKLFGIQEDMEKRNNVLGKCHERKTRFREPITSKPLKQVDGRIVGIYNTLQCSDVNTVSCG